LIPTGRELAVPRECARPDLGAYGEEGEMPGRLGLGPHHLAVTLDGTVYTTEVPILRVQKFVPR